MTSRITIRRATDRDAGAVARLAGELGYPTPTKAMRARVRAILASENDLLVVATGRTGEVVGWLQAKAATIVESGYRVEITGLVVLPAVRRGGVGRALVAEVERWAKSMSATAIVVRSNARRVESHSFYPALGYISTKTQVVYRKLLPRPTTAESCATGDRKIKSPRRSRPRVVCANRARA